MKHEPLWRDQAKKSEGLFSP